ncbi:MAG: SLBB domain-containing protein [Desulfobacterales bacterium]|nr:SLBB domain-containing protein [Desulfobacterales bacterium]
MRKIIIISTVLYLFLIINSYAEQMQIQSLPSLAAPEGSSIKAISEGQQPQGQGPIMDNQIESPVNAPVNAPVQADVEALSEYEQFISGKGPSTISTNLKQFGYELFNNSPSTFAPVQNVPVGSDYIIGPGDEIRIAIWGKIEGQWSVAVNRDGKIILPKIGSIGVNGFTFSELKSFLYKEFSKYYTGFEMSLSMGSLRSIRVYIVGNAKKPGAYTVSSLSSLVNALFEAGGPSKKGTMRDIQLKRNGKTIINFDFYDFLLKGDKTKDIRLMPEDVIFVPIIGSFVSIAGNIKKPAIYEFDKNMKLLDIIEMAGGLTCTAFKGRVQVVRIKDNQSREIFEGDLIDLEKNPKKNFYIKDGDLIKIYSVVETNNFIKLVGAVANPGEYGILPNVTTIKDVILKAGGLLYFASNKAELFRINATPTGPMSERFIIDTAKALQDDLENNITLKVNDFIQIRTIPEWELYRMVTISGEVLFPGSYATKKGETLSSVIERAGGFTDSAYLKGAIFTRISVKSGQQKSLTELIDRVELQMFSSSQTIMEPVQVAQQKVFISKLRQITPQGRLVFNLEPLDKFKNSKDDISLEEGDNLYIPETPTFINVIGSVYNSVALIYDPVLSVNTYIDMAGGTTTFADKKSIFILKSNGSALPHKTKWFSTTSELLTSKLEPGDTIIVPEKIEKIVWMQEIKDITQILYQIAVTAGVIIVAF